MKSGGLFCWFLFLFLNPFGEKKSEHHMKIQSRLFSLKCIPLIVKLYFFSVLNMKKGKVSKSFKTKHFKMLDVLVET